LAVDLDLIEFAGLRFPLVTNVDAQMIATGPAAKSGLKRQVSRPVRWHECVQRLIVEGVNTFVEVGPGKVLLGLIRSIDKSVTLLHVEDEKSVENALNALL
jgi:[acyl-carrier-protein] S-malonyltransferase